MNKITFALATAIALGIASPVFVAGDSGPSINVTSDDGTVIGRDPDINVRLQMSKDNPYIRNGGN